MARAIASNFERRASYEPLYDFDPRTEASVEVFYADQVLAKSFDTRPGWFWWTCRPAVQQAGSALCRGPVHVEEVWSARNRTGTAHAWNEKYEALYDRTYRVLYDAGIDEKLADELATHRTLAAALTSCEKPPGFVPQRSIPSDRFALLIDGLPLDLQC